MKTEASVSKIEKLQKIFDDLDRDLYHLDRIRKEIRRTEYKSDEYVSGNSDWEKLFEKVDKKLKILQELKEYVEPKGVKKMLDIIT